jgi:diaminopimelate decarboxylase
VGAYGYSMSSNYNARLRAAEVMVTAEGVKLIRRREKFEDIIKTEE